MTLMSNTWWGVINAFSLIQWEEIASLLVSVYMQVVTEKVDLAFFSVI